METLFALDPVAPEGFHYFPDFITSEEEQTLLNEIAGYHLPEMVFQGYVAKRKVLSFGYDWSFEKRRLTKGKEIPGAFMWLINRISFKLKIAEANICEVLVTEYPEGSVINWHRDAPPFDTIIGLSLLSDCKFKLKPYDKQKGSTIITIPVKRRSLYVMKGESKSEWQHSIAPVKEKRYSITFRTLTDQSDNWIQTGA